QLRGTAPPGAPGRALADVLQAVADEQAVVVFVDDAHWLDRESLLALGGAMRDLAGLPVAFLLAVAPHPAGPGLGEVGARGGGGAGGREPRGGGRAGRRRRRRSAAAGAGRARVAGLARGRAARLRIRRADRA